MRVIKKIFRNLFWLVSYLTFNISLYIIEMNILFKKSSSHTNSSGFEVLDVFLEVVDFFGSLLNSLAMLAFFCIDVGLAVVGFIIFVPLWLRVLKPKYQNNKNKFSFSLLIAFGIVIALKLILYVSMYFESIG